MLCSFIFAASECSAQASASSAARDVMDAVCEYAASLCPEPESGAYDYYVSKSPLVSPVVGGMPLAGEHWLVFVDQMPEANWEHPCKYIYLKQEPGVSGFSAHVVDSCLPPRGVDFHAYRLSDRSLHRMASPQNAFGNTHQGGMIFPGGSDMKPGDVRDPFSFKFSRNTYAVIISGGENPESNASRYWNDCSFMYKTLIRKYGVPKENVKVLMSDGRSPGKDLNNGLTEVPDLVSSPLDLDGDDRCDIDYSATKDTLQAVLADISGRMTDQDHLLVFVTDHGGYDETKDQSYISLWNNGRLYPDELASCFRGSNAGYVSFILGQCNSGGFIPALKGSNHIVITACKENERSYSHHDFDCDHNEFLYNFTSALNRSDTYGNSVSAVSDTLPSGKVAPVTLKKAFDYAFSKDYYNKGRNPRLVETPQLWLLEKSTAEDLAIDTIPPTVYLYITRGNTTFQIPEISGDSGDVPTLKNPFRFWTSSDIWLRNQNDGFVNWEYEMPKVTEANPKVYIYTRVGNRGVKEYQGNDAYLHTWWANSSVVLDMATWKGYRDSTAVGGDVDYDRIKVKIKPGESKIIEYDYEFKRLRLEKAMQPGFNMCLLSFITCEDENRAVPVTDSGIAKVWATDRLGQKNCFLISPKPSDPVVSDVLLFPPGWKDAVTLVFIKEKAASVAQPDVEIKVNMQPDMGGSTQLKGFRRNKVNPQLVTMEGEVSYIRGVTALPDRVGHLNLSASVVANMEILNVQKRNVDVIALNEATGEVLGGERFCITISPRPKLEPYIEKVANSDGSVTLSAANLSESVSCEWYDESGNLAGTDASLTVNSVTSPGTYTLRVTADSDNAVNSATADVEKTPFLREVSAVRPGYVGAEFAVPAPEGSTARITSSAGTLPVMEYDIEEGSGKATFALPAAVSDVIQLSVIHNGKVIDTKKIKY